MRERYGTISNLDWLTVFIWLALILIGWISVYAAVYDEEHSSIFTLSQNYGKQLVWIITAIILAGTILLIDIKFFPAFAYVIYALAMLALVAVLLFGNVVAGSKSWFHIGGFTLQPAEFAKYAACLALARAMRSSSYDIKTIRGKLIAFGIVAIPAALILLQNDTGSMLVFAAFLLVFYREGLSGFFIVFGFVVAALAVLTLYFGEIPIIIASVLLAGIAVIFIKRSALNIAKVIAILIVSVAFIHIVEYSFENFLQAHQKARINVILGKEIDLRGVGYNLHQSKIAIGSGGLTGKGFLQGTQTKFSFVPEQSTDFIFCTIGEEWGFFGSLVLIALYVMLLIRLIILAERQRSSFSRIFGYGVASVLFFHFTVNIGMTIGLVPVVGIPLPFVSYGGSSIWAFTIMLFTFLKQDANRLALL
ncbi:MAG TPA: rod shape-determining protein RodA [Bacteroidales bacterium]|nr:rod shape-determining protein RodA [Bacteroidales bacterium]